MSDSETFEIHLETGPVQPLLADIGHCRLATCPIVQRQPFYPTPDDPPLYGGKRPCNPVVPTFTAVNRVMIIGQFPNCRFGTVNRPDGTQEAFIPVGDINEPFEAGRYFDGFSTRTYPTAHSLHQFYLGPLGLELATDVWLTNLVKCYTMKQSHIDRYAALGWIQPGDPQPKPTSDDYFEVASVCGTAWLKQEIDRANPQLIIALGERNYRMIHTATNFGAPGADIVFDEIVGVPLRAGISAGPLDNRSPLFRERNVIHLSHPSRLLYEEARRERHLDDDIARTRQFMSDLGIFQQLPKFQIFRGIDHQFYFRLRAGNGEPVLASEGYRQRQSCQDGIDSVKRNAGADMQYRRRVAVDGQFYFTLVARNGQPIGRSELYTTAQARDRGIDVVQQGAPLAPVELLL